MHEEGKEFVASIRKAIKIIETFSEDDTLLGIQELSEKTGYSKTAVHRIVQTLMNEGWMIQDERSKKYGLGYGLLGYENLVLIHESLIKLCSPVMKELRDEFNETVFLTIIEGHFGRCIYKVESAQHIKLIGKVGKTMPLYAGATAKCLLAFQDMQYIKKYLDTTDLKKFNDNTVIDKNEILKSLEKIRSNKYATSESEVDMDTFTVSVPIFNKRGCILGCISISCPTYRHTQEIENKMIKLNLEACKEINNKLGSI